MHLPRHVAWYLICFMIGSALGLVPILIVEILEKTNDSAAATIVAIMREMQAAVVISGAFSFITVEGITMLAEIFLRNREEKGRQEGRVEGREEGREEERQEIASRLEGTTTTEELRAEVARIIEEARNGRDK